MRLVTTADWHGTLPESLPEGDVLAIVGDTTPVWDHDRKFQAQWLGFDLATYLDGLDFEHILLVGGNHDFVMQASLKWMSSMPDNVTYLQDESIEIDGIDFHGSPWSNQFGKWAFMALEDTLATRWAKIAPGTEVMLVHGPPYGACDVSFYGQMNAGSRTLREAITIIKPKLVACGHIHEGYGLDQIGRTIIANSSFMDHEYRPGNPPHVFDVTPDEITIVGR